MIAVMTVGVATTLLRARDDAGPRAEPSGARHEPTPIRRATSQRDPLRKPLTNTRGSHIAIPEPDTTIGYPSFRQTHEPDLYVEVGHGDVTVRAVNRSLKEVLEVIAQKSGMQIDAQMIADRPLTIDLDGRPVDQALRDMLVREDVLFAFQNRGSTDKALTAAWVLPGGTAGTRLPNVAACPREVADLEDRLTAEASSQRAEAIEALIDLQGPDALPAVVQSLADQDDEVRYRALEKAHVAGLALPPEVLASLVEKDTSELVRMMAIEAVGYHPSIDEQDKIALARVAINDSSPAVQTRSSEILSHLETLERDPDVLSPETDAAQEAYLDQDGPID